MNLFNFPQEVNNFTKTDRREIGTILVLTLKAFVCKASCSTPYNRSSKHDAETSEHDIVDVTSLIGEVGRTHTATDTSPEAEK